MHENPQADGPYSTAMHRNASLTVYVTTSQQQKKNPQNDGIISRITTAQNNTWTAITSLAFRLKYSQTNVEPATFYLH